MEPSRKVAIYISGHLRNLKDTIHNYRRVFRSPGIEFDFFFVLWKVNHTTESTSWKHNNATQKKLVEIQAVTEADVYAICPEAKKVILLDEHILPPEYDKHDRSIAYKDYGLYRAFLEVPDTYDLYVRLRTDLYFFEGIDWEYLFHHKSTYNLFLLQKAHFTKLNYPGSRIFDDSFWISTYAVGKYISEMYLNLPTMKRGKRTEEYYADYLDREKFSILKYPFDLAIERRTRGFDDNLEETAILTARRKECGDFV